MTNLLHDNRTLERRLLSIIALELNPRLIIANAIRRRRGVMADLLRHERRGARVVGPGAQEELAEEGVQRLLLVAKLLAAAGVLVLEGREEPLEDEHGALGGVGLEGGRGEHGGVRGPVCGEFGEGLRGEDEGRGG